MIDVGRVFSSSFSLLRQRFWLLLGMWAVFFAIQIVGSLVLMIGLGVVGLAGSAAFGAGLEDPSALAGLGIGVILSMIVFYGAYIVLLLVQQAAMVALASPLEQPSFGGALNRGFKSALPFLGIAVLLLIGYLAVSMIMSALVDALSLTSATAGGLLALLLGPMLVYFACRFSVLVPVLAVEQVFNPINAIRRSWSVTGGKVFSILLALIGFIVISVAMIALPILLIFGAAFSAESDPGAGAGMAIASVLLLFPLMILYTMFASVFTGSLHAEVTGGGSERLEDVFA